MLPPSRLRVLLLVTLLLATAGLSHALLSRSETEPRRQPLLEEAFLHLEGWPGVVSLPLGEALIRELRLDDHLFRIYSRGDDALTLYVGYYRGAHQVGAAHDPLVCFQGQGWRVSARETSRHALPAESGAYLNLAWLTAERQAQRELVVYWFQTAGTTSAETFSQKLAMIWQRLRGGDETSAFVRINLPLGDESADVSKQKILEFIDVFYPRFHAYVTGG